MLKVNVLLATYNGEVYIIEAVVTIYKQKKKPLGRGFHGGLYWT